MDARSAAQPNEAVKPEIELDETLAAAPMVPLVTDPRRQVTVFLLLMTAMFMATLDNQIVSTALPTIVGEFGQLERFGWVGSAYLLATSAVMPLYGKLGDLFGRKPVIMMAIAIFTIGSLVCGLAVSMDTLIAARVLQALGGGGIMVSILSITADIFQPRDRARYQSYLGLVLMASSAAGPVLGGTMSELFGWRSIFLINLPFGIFVLIGLYMLLPYRKPDRRPKIDFLGAILLAGAITSIVFWADSGQIFGSIFALQSLAVLLAGAVLAFIWVKVEQRVPEPILPLSIFRSRTVILLLFISMASGAIGIGTVNYVALFLQMTTGLSPAMAGLLFVATTGGIAIGGILGGRLIARSGRYKPFAIVSATVGLVTMLLFAQLHAGTPVFIIIALMLVQGLGVGIGQQVPTLGVQNATARADVGAATSAVTLTRMGGAAIAISIYGAIISAGLANRTLALPGGADFKELTPSMLASLPPDLQHAVASIYSDAFDPMFLAAALLVALALIAAILLPNIRLPKTEKQELSEKEDLVAHG